jgi:hypothetical protein
VALGGGLAFRSHNPKWLRIFFITADYANDLWQADMLQGLWLPDPEKPGNMRRAHLYSFIDDASRLVLNGSCFFKGGLPALEFVLKLLSPSLWWRYRERNLRGNLTDDIRVGE